MARKLKRAGPARNAILEAARRLFESKDFTAVTLDEVAQKAGVSRQAVYVNFGSRAGLLVALTAYVDERGGLQKGIARVLERPTAVDTLKALVDFRAKYTPSILRLAAHVDAARRFDVEAQAMWQQRMRLRYAHSLATARRLAAEGVLAAGWTEPAAADLIWSLTSIRTFEDLVIERRWSVADYRRRVKAILISALIVRGRRRAPA